MESDPTVVVHIRELDYLRLKYTVVELGSAFVLNILRDDWIVFPNQSVRSTILRLVTCCHNCLFPDVFQVTFLLYRLRPQLD